jgi:enoyl-CoA hydratase/carnithine racemase
MTVFCKIRLEGDSSVRRIVLTNPGRKNAIGPQMVNELLHAFASLAANESVRVVVLSGEGDAFCAGGDFGQMTGLGTNAGSETAPALAYKGDYADLLLAMVRFEKPIIASVNGAAMGGGLGLVASTFAIAHDLAVLGTPEINVGLFPMMMMAVLARLVPRRRLTAMMLTGEKMLAAEAFQAGILSSVVPVANLDNAVSELAQKLAQKSPIALALGLRAFSVQDDLALSEALPYLRERLGEILGTNDAREGLLAFLEKRAPHWTGT